MLAVILMTAAITANAESSLGNCIIEGMRGVSSDAAAAMIKQVCERKTRQTIYDEYGAIEAQMLKVEAYDIEDSILVVQVKNTTRNTVTLISLAAGTPDAVAGCPSASTASFVFKANVKPSSSVKLRVPAAGMVSGGRVCFTANSRLARAMRWNDFVVGTKDPITPAEYEMLVKAYSMKLGYRFEP